MPTTPRTTRAHRENMQVAYGPSLPSAPLPFRPDVTASDHSAPNARGVSRRDLSQLDGGTSGLSDVAMAVASFHVVFGLPYNNMPTVDVPAELVALRVRLLAEEVDEFARASAAGDIVGMADALADIVYVAYGSAVTYGIDLDAVLAEVHRSNLSKLDADGRPILRSDGKVLKSQRYTPADVAGVLHRQPRLPW